MGLLRFPTTVRLIIANEACERFCFYGMKSVLVLYLNSHLGFARNEASAWFAAFTAACYFSPLLGGYLSDAYLGKYITILVFRYYYVTERATALWRCSSCPGILNFPPLSLSSLSLSLTHSLSLSLSLYTVSSILPARPRWQPRLAKTLPQQALVLRSACR
jgi:hypothetical protein